MPEFAEPVPSGDAAAFQDFDPGRAEDPCHHLLLHCALLPVIRLDKGCADVTRPVLGQQYQEKKGVHVSMLLDRAWVGTVSA